MSWIGHPPNPVHIFFSIKKKKSAELPVLYLGARCKSEQFVQVWQSQQIRRSFQQPSGCAPSLLCLWWHSKCPRCRRTKPWKRCTKNCWKRSPLFTALAEVPLIKVESSASLRTNRGRLIKHKQCRLRREQDDLRVAAENLNLFSGVWSRFLRALF